MHKSGKKTNSNKLSEPFLASEDSFKEKNHTKSLSWISIASIAFFSTGGGPFGFEEAIIHSVPAMCYLIVLTLTLLWAIPQVLISSELSTCFPRGFNEWITEAFGPFVGMFHSTIRIAFNLITNTIYVSLFTKYFMGFVDNHSLPTKIICVTIVVILIVCYNLAGVKMIGSGTVWMVLIVLFPFLLMFLLSIPQLRLRVLFDLTSFSSGDFSITFSIIMFNLMGWDLVGNLCPHTQNPSKDVPIGLFTAVIVLFFSYTFPLWSVASVLPRSLWTVELYAITGKVLWLPLFYLINIIALIALFGMGSTFMATTAESVIHAADFNYAPKFFFNARLRSTNAPWAIIVLQGIFIILLGIPLKFVHLVQVQMWLYCLSIILITCAFIMIRYRERNETIADNPSVMKLPFSFEWCTVIGIPPIILCSVGILSSHWQYIVVGVSITLCALVISLIWRSCFLKKQNV